MPVRSSAKPRPTNPRAFAQALYLLPAAAWGRTQALVPPLNSDEWAGSPAAIPPTSAGDTFTQAFFLNLGFSFLVGLAAGYALKIAFKIALLVIGVILFGVFGLQYAGLVDINWSGVEGHYDSFAQWLQIQGGTFLDFMAQNLSSGASFLAGLVIGLKL